MNYQLMFQTMAMLCGFVSIILGIFVLGGFDKIPVSYKRAWVIIFILTLVSGSLAAGLS